MLKSVKIVPRCRNKKTREERVVKWLDRILVVEALSDSVELLRQWLECEGKLDHSPIILEIRGIGKKSPSPFKFNVEWLKEPSFVDLVQGL